MTQLRVYFICTSTARYIGTDERLWCLRHAKFCWVGKHINNIMKPTNSPTDGQPNPRKNRGSKWRLGHFFPQHILFRGMGLALYRKQTARNLAQPNYPRTPYFEVYDNTSTYLIPGTYPGGLVGYARAYENQFRDFNSHRVHIRTRKDFFMHRN